MMTIRWYLRYSLSYRDVEKLLAERGVTVDQVKPSFAARGDLVRRGPDSNPQDQRTTSRARMSCAVYRRWTSGVR
jgi:hypothetical protein